MRRFCAALCFAALLPSMSGAADSKASRYYEDALTRYEKKDLAGAIIQLKNALQIDNGMLQAHLLLGKSLLQNSEVAAAEVAFVEALRLGVDRAEVAVPLGQALLNQGKHKKLFDQPELRLEGLPAGVKMRLLLLRAVASADQGNTRDALQAIAEARSLDPRAPDSWLAEAPIRIRSRQYPEARVAVDRALELAPKAVDAWLNKASLFHTSGAVNEALVAYGRVIELDSAHAEARIARAGLLIDLGRHTDAAQDVTALTKAAPNEPRAVYLRALLAEHDGKGEDARKAFRDLTTLIDPVSLDFIRYRPQLLMLNGLAHFGLGENEKAKTYLEAFLRVQAGTPVAKLLAQIYLAESRVDKAIEVLDAYLKAQPADGQALMLLGSAYQSKGQHSRAVSLMKRALEARDAPEFRTVLGFSLIRSGQAGNAIPELEAALKLDPGQPQAATALVELYLRSGQSGKAVALAESMVKRRPASADFYNLLGVAKRQSGDKSARAAFEQAIKHDVKHVGAHLNLARLDIASAAYAVADARLQEVLKFAPNNTEAMYESAVLAERRKQMPDAQRWLEKAVDVSGNAIRWALALSDFHLRQGNAVPALEAVKKASSRAPENPLVLVALAKAQLAGNDAASARATLSIATRVAAFNAPMQVQIALLQSAAGNLAGAAFSLEKALSDQPADLPAQALMAEVDMRQGELAKAEKRARSILEKHPKLAIGHSLLGDIALVRSQGPAALESYRNAHRAEPSTDTLLRLFRNLSGKDDKVALQLAEQWLKTHPEDMAVLRALADGEARLGDYQSARKSYESILKRVPEDGWALNNLANVLFRMRDSSAIKVAERAASLSPGNPYIIDTLGWIAFNNGENDRALQLLRDARLRAPDNSEIRYHLATALSKAGRKAEAREELKEALKTMLPYDWLNDARALLDTLN